MMRWIKASLIIVIPILLPSCLPFQLEEEIPVNEGLTHEMWIQPVEGWGNAFDQQTVRSTIEAKWLKERAYRSWFTVVDEPNNSEKTVWLVPEITYLELSTRNVGSKKFGFKTRYEARADVSLKLIHVQTNKFIAVGTGAAYSSDVGQPLDYRRRALELATARALYNLVWILSGRR